MQARYQEFVKNPLVRQVWIEFLQTFTFDKRISSVCSDLIE